LSRRPDFQIIHVWYLSVASVVFQAIANYLLLQREFRKKLVFEDTPGLTPAEGSAPSIG
jgi:hypothetical protein